MRSGIIVPLTLLGSAGASVVPHLSRSGSQPVCGQDEVSEAQKELLAGRLQTVAKSSYLRSRANEIIDVNVYQHVVAFNETLEGGYLPLIQDSFAPFNFNMKLAETRWVVDESLASVNKGDDHENVVRKALRKGTYADLNLFYMASLTVGIGNQGTGWSTWPWGSGTWTPNSTVEPSEFEKSIDGCFVNSATGGCSGPGDYVNDTFPQGSDTFTVQGVCENTRPGCFLGTNPPNYKNHMDYSDDPCRVEFTKGQEARMRQMWDEFRVNTV
ncbi:metalloprotease [Diaporthe helianthi]|uniref:Metalloprotease n=1 Tax=Diaporthe helianthi TaxID=158607 RepID=A0A2P5HH67_DIAHE|nr:metalloprotease [Diaporthe helianthi]